MCPLSPEYKLVAPPTVITAPCWPRARWCSTSSSMIMSVLVGMQLLSRKRTAREAQLQAALKGPLDPGFESVSGMHARACTHICVPVQLHRHQECKSGLCTCCQGHPFAVSRLCPVKAE